MPHRLRRYKSPLHLVFKQTSLQSHDLPFLGFSHPLHSDQVELLVIYALSVKSKMFIHEHVCKHLSKNITFAKGFFAMKSVDFYGALIFLKQGGSIIS